MVRSIEVRVDPNGTITPIEPLNVSEARRAILTILDDEPLAGSALECYLMSHDVLARDWLDPQQEAAYRELADLPALDDDGKEIK